MTFGARSDISVPINDPTVSPRATIALTHCASSVSVMFPLRATVNCDMGEGYALYVIGDDESLMKTIHLANVACGFHASDFNIMNKTVVLAKANGVLVGAHPSLPDRQGWGRREMVMEPDELASCFIYQVGALTGFLKVHNVELNHLKPHGAVYGMTSRDLSLARAVVGVAKTFGVPFMGLAGTCHQAAAEELGVPFIAEWFADLEYSPEGKLLITKKHIPVPVDVVRARVAKMLSEGLVTTQSGFVPLGAGVTNVSICCHSDTPGAVEIAYAVKAMVDESNARLG
ncbi:lactam utilization protein lamb [Laetiporus sulphureus 93-53]|uniref:Lactam utilization protein lamb n=1 Tax=Laetiporus sulphureus 93-53 TaxID=1314785 RepID=A0A165CLX9_9APHY|nr:lactam utilization protein lamb [Laetiporus sulphureus 93-53]KZT03046.1 lactam utilization protein lamb [Laetiporus sulphureus 93-53]